MLKQQHTILIKNDIHIEINILMKIFNKKYYVFFMYKYCINMLIIL